MIYHITTADAWAEALTRGHYETDSLQSEGFIHCSTQVQLLIPANERFRGQTDLILLEIDPFQVAARLVYEDCYDSGQAFPHIYGVIPLTAVKRHLPFPPNADGSFSLPAELL